MAVLEGGSARCSPTTLNRHLAALFSFYDYQARNGVPLAQQLAAWRRSNRGGFRPFLHHATGGRAVATRPPRVRQPGRVPRTLTDDQLLAVVEACEHLRDRFLLVLLAETGMRVGQALGFAVCRLRLAPPRAAAGADTGGMVVGHQGGVAISMLAAFAALMVSVVGCTGSSGRPPSAGSAPATARSTASDTPQVCTRAEVTAAISGFFDAWNRHDAAALGRLFTAGGVLDMATKHQDTLTGGGWASAGGRGTIAAFARRQWRLGEKLSYHGVTIFPNGGVAADGGYADNVVATFGDGMAQPMDEAKFAYGCASHAFAHVVIVSAKAAAA